MYKNFTAFICGKQRCRIYNTVLIVNVTFILATATCLQASAATNNVRVNTLKAEKATLKEVLENKVLTGNKALINSDNVIPPKKISGQIVDSKNLPLPGVTIEEKGTQNRVVSDSKGNYSITVSNPTATLVYRFLGFDTKEIVLKNSSSSVSVILEDAGATQLEDVQVVGYGSQKKETVTGAISSIGSKEITQAPVTNLSNALAGRLPGLTAVQSSGEPGADGATLTIRGVGTYTGETQPLIMVDGIERASWDDLDPNEVESVSVLKDASATAVYGVRGANGVILITTKRGREGAPKVTLSAQTAISEFANVPNFVNSYQFASLLDEQSYELYWVNHANDADIHSWGDFESKRDANWVKEAPLYYSPEDLKYYQNAHTPTINGQTNPYYDPYGHPDQSWLYQIFKKSAPQTQYNATISGGTKNVRYFTSLGYFDQTGQLQTDYLPLGDADQYKKTRYNYRSNFDFDVNKSLTVSVNIAAQFQSVRGLSQGQGEGNYIWVKKILWSSPLGSPGIVDGKFVLPYNNQNDQLNPLYAIANNAGYNVADNSQLQSQIKATQKLDFITPGLSISIQGSYDSYFQSGSDGNAPATLYTIRQNPNGNLLDPIIVQFNQPAPPSQNIYYYNGKNRQVYGELSVNYNRTFAKKHAVSALILADAEKQYQYSDYSEYDLPHAIEGFVGRVTYAYADKYLLDLDAGYNGSENFPEGKRFGFFPSGSAGWVATNESFIPKNDILTFLKIRGSIGKVGNDRITTGSGVARYLYLPDTWQYSSGYNLGGYTFGDLNNRHTITGALESTIGNPDVTWETATKWNLGTDIHLFNEHLQITYDHYHEYRDNILSYKGTIPDIVQATLPPYNLGIAKNWGDEVAINYTSVPGKFTWNIGANISTNYNKIVFRDEAITPGLEYQASTGRPINQNNYLDAQGLYTSWAQLYAIDGNGNPILSSPVRALNAQGQPYLNAAGQPVYQKDLGYNGRPLQPGDVKIRDVNGDGVINDKDYIRTGKTNLPTFSYGVPFGFQYKGFDLQGLIQGVAGVENFSMNSIDFHFNKQQSLFTVDENRFTQDRYNNGDEIDFPIAAYDQAAGYNTFFLKNTAYVRLKSLMLGYTFSGAFLKSIGIRSARIYTSGYNLFTISSNSIWGDPEHLGYTSYPITRIYNLGFNVGF